MQAPAGDEITSIDPFAELPAPHEEDTAPTVYAQPIQPPQPMPTLADIDQQNRAPHEEARAAIDAAFNAAPPAQDLAAPLQDIALQPAAPAGMPPLPDFSTLPPPPPAPDFGAPAAPSSALPPDKLEDMLSPAPAPATSAAPTDPTQYKIPGQS